MYDVVTATAEITTVAAINHADLIERYVASLDLKPRTTENYKKNIAYFFSWLQGQGISQPSREDVLNYKRELIGKYSNCTVSAYISALKGFFAYLEAEKIYPNIAASIKGAKAPQGFKKDVLSIDGSKAVLETMKRESVEEKRNFAIVNLLIRTGLRTVEAARADIADIRTHSGATVLYIQGKGRDSKDSFVVLTENAYRPIREYLTARGHAANTEPLFASCSDRNNGERLTSRSISRIAKEALKAAGFDSDKLTAHSLRHTAVTLSLIGGATIQEAQQMARHSSINTTLIYAHNIDRISNAAESHIDSLI